jgi:glycosyltransferase involved in cell wall biosynthesis
MRCPRLSDLPSPPAGATGWPWTVESVPLPDMRPDGEPWPSITIVTPSYNQGQFIEETIRSVLLQGYPALEYIIIDGGSTDDSVAVIKRYAPWLSYWQSQPDNGQADAINIGLSKASGHWFQNINSDDVLLEGALEAVGNCDTDADLCTGDVIEFGGDREYVVANTNNTVADLLHWKSSRKLISWHQPGVFLRRDRLQQLGGYPTQFHYAFDFYLVVLYIEMSKKYANTFKPLVRFRLHLTSKSSSLQDIFTKESILTRDLLGETLRLPENRRIARLEAARRKVFAFLGNAPDSSIVVSNVRCAVRQIVWHPSILLERMVLGDIRRKPLLWLRAIFGPL